MSHLWAIVSHNWQTLGTWYFFCLQNFRHILIIQSKFWLIPCMNPPIDTLKSIREEWFCSKLQVWCEILQQVLGFENLGLFPSTLSITEILNTKFQAPRAIFWLIRAPWKHQNQIWSSYMWLFKMVANTKPKGVREKRKKLVLPQFNTYWLALIWTPCDELSSRYMVWLPLCIDHAENIHEFPKWPPPPNRRS